MIGLVTGRLFKPKGGGGGGGGGGIPPFMDGNGGAGGGGAFICPLLWGISIGGGGGGGATGVDDPRISAIGGGGGGGVGVGEGVVDWRQDDCVSLQDESAVLETSSDFDSITMVNSSLVISSVEFELNWFFISNDEELLEFIGKLLSFAFKSLNFFCWEINTLS